MQGIDFFGNIKDIKKGVQKNALLLI